MKAKAFFLTVLVSAGVILMFVDETNALPTFAQKYRTSCTTCHIGFFKLNPFGETFRQNGYVIPGGQDAPLVKEEPVSLGAEAWKRAFPDTVWPGAIPANVPVSFYAHQRIFVDESKDPSVNFKFPHEFKLFTGGTAGEGFSFWSEYNLQSSTLNRIFLRFNDLFSKKNWGSFGIVPEDALNLRVGRLDVGTLLIPLNTRRTINKAAPFTYALGSGAAAWDFSDLQSGIEANGVVAHRVQYATGVVNGLSSSGTPAGVEDNNDAKDYYYRVAYKHGGLSFDGKELAGDQEAELKQTDNWVDNALTIGQFGYFGTTTVSTGIENQFRRIGGDARINFGNLDLYGALLFGHDGRPTSTASDVKSWSWFTEADYVIFPWLSAAFGYEKVNYDEAFREDTGAIIGSLLAWPRANIKLMIEGKVFPEELDGNPQYLIDLTYAF